MLATELGSLSHPDDTGLEGMKQSWRIAEAWVPGGRVESPRRGQKRPLVESVALVIIDNP